MHTKASYVQIIKSRHAAAAATAAAAYLLTTPIQFYFIFGYIDISSVKDQSAQASDHQIIHCLLGWNIV